MKQRLNRLSVSAYVAGLIVTTIAAVVLLSRNTNAANTGSIQLVKASTQYLTSSSNSFSTGNSARTMEAWIKLTSYTDGVQMLSYGTRANYQNWDWLIGDDGRQVVGTYGENYRSNTVLTLGVWTHVAITYDGATLTFYKDGVPDGTATFSNTPNTGSGNTNYIGINNGVAYVFDGYIDDVRIWNTTRSQRRN